MMVTVHCHYTNVGRRIHDLLSGQSRKDRLRTLHEQSARVLQPHRTFTGDWVRTHEGKSFLQLHQCLEDWMGDKMLLTSTPKS